MADNTEMTLVLWKAMQHLQLLHHLAALTEVANSSRAHMADQPQTKLVVWVFFNLDTDA